MPSVSVVSWFALLFVAASVTACGAASSSNASGAAGDGGASSSHPDAASATTNEDDAGSASGLPGTSSDPDASAASGAGADGGAANGDDAGDDDGGDAGIQPVTLPLTAKGGASFISASFAGGAATDVLFDTGSTGIWVVPSALGAGTALPTGPTLHATYGGCLKVSGPSGMLPFTLGSITVNVQMAVATSMTTTGNAGCNPSPPADKILNGAGVVGIGLRTPANGLVNPLPLMTARGRWILSMSPIGTPTGTVTLNPGSGAARFTNRTQLVADGSGGWDDTAVPFCVNAFCKNGLVDSGESSPILLISDDADYATIGIADGSTTVPSGTMLTWTVNSGPSYSFTVSNTPETGIDLIKVQTSGFSNNLGTVAFRYLDWYYDSQNGVIGAAAKM